MNHWMQVYEQENAFLVQLGQRLLDVQQLTQANPWLNDLYLAFKAAYDYAYAIHEDKKREPAMLEQLHRGHTASQEVSEAMSALARPSIDFHLKLRDTLGPVMGQIQVWLREGRLSDPNLQCVAYLLRGVNLLPSPPPEPKQRTWWDKILAFAAGAATNQLAFHGVPRMPWQSKALPSGQEEGA